MHMIHCSSSICLEKLDKNLLWFVLPVKIPLTIELYCNKECGWRILPGVQMTPASS